MRTVLLTILLLAAVAPAASALERPAGTVHRAECPFYADGGSCARPETGELWLAPGASRFAEWHELAHLFDHQTMTDRHRAWFARLLRFPDGADWYQGTGPGTHGPSEVFADAFATCATRRPARQVGRMTVSRETMSYGWEYTRREYRRVCNGIAVLQYLSRQAAGL
jgi:hypothetical protein